MKKLFIALMALGFVASAAAIPAHAQAQQQTQEEPAQASNNSSESMQSDERGSVDAGSQPVKRGPPAFVQDKMPQVALDNVPDFFW